MAMIPLISGFSIVPEGTHIFQITDVEYKEAFGKMEISMKTADGQTHKERFTFIKADRTPNEGAMKAFSFFAKNAMNNFNLTEISHTDLIGHYIKCEVTHDVQPNKNDPSKTVTFVRLGDKAPASGFETASPAVSTGTESAKPEKPVFDLKSMLGR